MLKTLGLYDIRHLKVGTILEKVISGGQRKRLNIALELIREPSILFIDEPTSGLDVITAENIINLIRQCKEQGKTVIFSSHIMSEVDLLCDDLVIIHRGKLCYNDTLENFKSQMKSNSLTEEFIKIIKDQNELSKT